MKDAAFVVKECVYRLNWSVTSTEEESESLGLSVADPAPRVPGGPGD